LGEKRTAYIQEKVTEKWDRLVKLCEMTAPEKPDADSPRPQGLEEE